MKSETWTVQQVFQDRKQYKVPFYQRAYVWRVADQGHLLWQDILEKATERLEGAAPAPHFLGAIVVEPQERRGLRGVDTLHIIDGQQRLTTLQYLLAAIRLATRELGDKGVEAFLGNALDNPYPDTMADPSTETFKVWPTFSDQRDYQQVMSADSLSDLKLLYPDSYTQVGQLRKIGVIHPKALEAVWSFAEWALAWIRANGGAVAAEALVEAVLKDLKVVLIHLEKGDDAQVIFETLNGRGAVLHATDLIRNHLFMTVDQTTSDPAHLYETKWKQFEGERWRLEERRGRINKPRLEWLIFSTIRAETGQEGDLGRLYVDFKEFGGSGSPPKTAGQLLDILDLYAKHYLELIEGKGAMPIARFGRRLAPYDTTTTHPLALRISTSQIPDSEKTAMFNSIVSYVVRRAVCGLTPKNYNNFFISVLRQLLRSEVSNAALKGLLGASNTVASRWPDDAEFTNAILNAPTYPGNLDVARCRMLLTELEGFLRTNQRTEEPNIPDLRSMDIDHIMPRSWYEHWSLPDGSCATASDAQAVQNSELIGVSLNEHQDRVRARLRAVPTLGNLSLLNLSVNREAQHKSFSTKKALLIQNTNLSLNVPLLTKDQWDEEAIAERGKTLATAAVTLYAK